MAVQGSGLIGSPGDGSHFDQVLTQCGITDYSNIMDVQIEMNQTPEVVFSAFDSDGPMVQVPLPQPEVEVKVTFRLPQVTITDQDTPPSELFAGGPAERALVEKALAESLEEVTPSDTGDNGPKAVVPEGFNKKTARKKKNRTNQ